MIIVNVRGIPNKVNVGRFSLFLKRMILKKKKSQFLITRVKDDQSEINIKFKSVKDAEIANNGLNGYVYNHKGEQYRLSSSMHETTEEFNYELENFDYNVPARERSRSPIRKITSSDELDEINRAIELTKKKRILIEEEKKLLLEQKKLQLLRRSKPATARELALLENSSEKASLETIDNMLAQKPREPKRKTVKTIFSTTIHKGCQRIFGQMARTFYLNATPDNLQVLRKLVNLSIRNRVKELIAKKDCSTSQEVLDLYRETYSESTDEPFILDLINKIDKELLNNYDEKPKMDSNTNQSINELSELKTDFDIEKDLDDWVDDTPEETLGNTPAQEVALGI